MFTGGGGILQLPTLFDKVLDKRRNEYNETLGNMQNGISGHYPVSFVGGWPDLLMIILKRKFSVEN